MTENTTQELELAPAESADISTLQRIDAPAIWDGFRAELEKIKNTAETLTVTSVEQKAEMKLAYDTRRTIAKIRIAVEHKRKEMVEGMKKTAAKIDTDARAIKETCATLEARLEAQEEFALRAEAERVAKLQSERTARIRELGGDPSFYPKLGEMPEPGFVQLIEGMEVAARLNRERAEKAEADRIAAEKAAEEARIAKEKAEAEERARIAAENERLRAEATEKEAALKAEREAAEKARLEELAASRKREAQLAEAARREREIADAAHKAEIDKQRKEREAADKEAKRIAEENRQKLLKIQAEAEAERAKQQAAAKKEHDRLQRIAEEERQKRAEAEQKEIERKAEQAAERAAAEKAPDRDKLTHLAAQVRAFELPGMASKEGKATVENIADKFESFAAWIEKQAEGM